MFKFLGSKKLIIWGGAAILTILAAQQMALAHKSSKIDKLNQSIGKLESDIATKASAIDRLSLANNNWQEITKKQKVSHNQCLTALSRYQAIEREYDQINQDNQAQIASLKEELDAYEWSSQPIPERLQRTTDNN